MNSLKSKFLIVLLPVVFLSLIGFGIINTSLSLKNIEQINLEKVESANEYLRKNINNWYTFNKNVLSTISQLDMIKGDSIDSSELSKYFETMKNNMGYRNIALLDSNSIAIATSNPGRLGVSYQNMSYVTRAHTENKTIVSQARFSRVDGTPLVTFAKPINKGTIFISVPLNNLYNDFVDATSVDKYSYSFLLTHDCKPLAHPRLGNNETTLPDYESLCKNQGAINFSEDGNNYSGIISKDINTNWFIISATNQSVVDKVIDESIHVFIATLIISTVFILISLLLLLRNITKKLSIVVNALDDLSTGDITINSVKEDEWSNIIRQQDELGLIGKSMNKLIHSQNKMVGFASNIANGDLSKKVEISGKKDILGIALSKMSDNLVDLITELQAAVKNVGISSASLNRDSDELQSGAIQQFESIEKISNFMDELRSGVSEQSIMASNMNERALHANNEANLSKEKVNEMIGSLKHIHESGNSISNIMSDIVKIAEQTNLIALNAAIEAARAGDYGRGFSVVADEVRGLAARSALAASKTTELVDKSLVSIGAGRVASTKTEEAFLLIVNHLGYLGDRIQEIHKSNEEEVKVIESLNNKLQDVIGITKDNKSSSKNVAQQCTSLVNLSENLNSEINKFKLPLAQKA